MISEISTCCCYASNSRNYNRITWIYNRKRLSVNNVFIWSINGLMSFNLWLINAIKI